MSRETRYMLSAFVTVGLVSMAAQGLPIFGEKCSQYGPCGELDKQCVGEGAVCYHCDGDTYLYICVAQGQEWCGSMGAMDCGTRTMQGRCYSSVCRNSIEYDPFGCTVNTCLP